MKSPGHDKRGRVCSTLLKKLLFLPRNIRNLTPKEIDTMLTEEILKEFVDEAAELSEEEGFAL